MPMLVAGPIHSTAWAHGGAQSQDRPGGFPAVWEQGSMGERKAFT